MRSGSFTYGVRAVAALLGALTGCTTDIHDPVHHDPQHVVGGNGTVWEVGGTGMIIAAGRGNGTGGKSGSGSSTGGGTTSNPPTQPQAGGSIVTTGGGPAKPNSPAPMDLHGEPIYARFVRLTNEQWERSVQDILKLSQASGLSSSFETPVAGTTEFTNNEHLLAVSAEGWDDYRIAAESLADEVTASDAALSRVHAGTDSSQFITAVGRRIYRRPLTTAEVQRYQAVFTTGSTMSGTGTAFSKGANLVLRTMFQSPFFLYRTELGTDGAPLNGYEVASKLSFWLRGTTPSDAHLDAAERGQFDSPEGIVQAAKDMLDEPAAAEVMKRFHAEMFNFQVFRTISKVNVPGYKEELNAEYEESSYRFFDRIFKENLGVRDILLSNVGFYGPNMASIYGLPAPANGFAQAELPGRVGFFTQQPYLSLHALNDRPDSILRGRDINLEVLCATLGMPVEFPPIPALQPGQTNREAISTITGGCGGECHNSLLNPVGFAFENYDGLGRVRTMDNGKPVDTKGAYPFAEGYKEFATAEELMTLIADGTQAHACYAKKLSSFALQRDIVESDIPLLETLKATSMSGSIRQVILELAKQPAFRTRVGGAQ